MYSCPGYCRTCDGSPLAYSVFHKKLFRANYHYRFLPEIAKKKIISKVFSKKLFFIIIDFRPGIAKKKFLCHFGNQKFFRPKNPENDTIFGTFSEKSFFRGIFITLKKLFFFLSLSISARNSKKKIFPKKIFFLSKTFFIIGVIRGSQKKEKFISKHAVQ